jgi:Ca2+:H+ antiporter
MMENHQIEMGAIKANGLEVPNGGLRSSVMPSWSLHKPVGRVLQSIRTVIFTSKLNLLMPFGPATIVLYYTTNWHVSVLFTQLVR